MTLDICIQTVCLSNYTEASFPWSWWWQCVQTLPHKPIRIFICGSYLYLLMVLACPSVEKNMSGPGPHKLGRSFSGCKWGVSLADSTWPASSLWLWNACLKFLIWIMWYSSVYNKVTLTFFAFHTNVEHQQLPPPSRVSPLLLLQLHPPTWTYSPPSAFLHRDML